MAAAARHFSIPKPPCGTSRSSTAGTGPGSGCCAGTTMVWFPCRWRPFASSTTSRGPTPARLMRKHRGRARCISKGARRVRRGASGNPQRSTRRRASDAHSPRHSSVPITAIVEKFDVCGTREPPRHLRALRARNGCLREQRVHKLCIAVLLQNDRELCSHLGQWRRLCVASLDQSDNVPSIGRLDRRFSVIADL